MRNRKLLIALSMFNAVANTLYLVRFIGILAPEEVVHGYVAWFMSFALPNTFITLTAWVLTYTLLKKRDSLAAISGLVNAGALIFHALNGLSFGLYTGSFEELTVFNAVFEVVVYVYGIALAVFYITQLRAVILRNAIYSVPTGKK